MNLPLRGSPFRNDEGAQPPSGKAGGTLVACAVQPTTDRKRGSPPRIGSKLCRTSLFAFIASGCIRDTIPSTAQGRRTWAVSSLVTPYRIHFSNHFHEKIEPSARLRMEGRHVLRTSGPCSWNKGAFLLCGLETSWHLGSKLIGPAGPPQIAERNNLEGKAETISSGFSGGSKGEPVLFLNTLAGAHQRLASVAGTNAAGAPAAGAKAVGAVAVGTAPKQSLHYHLLSDGKTCHKVSERPWMRSPEPMPPRLG